MRQLFNDYALMVLLFLLVVIFGGFLVKGAAVLAYQIKHNAALFVKILKGKNQAPCLCSAIVRIRC